VTLIIKGRINPMEESFPSFKKIAKIAGITYPIQMAASIAGYIPPSQLIVSSDVAQTASNIIASERLFRFGIASNLVTYITVVLTWSLYQLLKPVNRNLALLAVFLRLAATMVLSVGVTEPTKPNHA
jgi:Domain of unknown function (DUF4386)